MKRKNGFTLIELLAVIVILALIMAITIPLVLQTMNNSKKEAFYMFAQNMQSKALSKYTQSMDLDELSDKNKTCIVYDIKDVVSDTGNYEGWVSIKKTATSSGTMFIRDSINKDSIISVKYCKTEDNACNPNKSYRIEENASNVDFVVEGTTKETVCYNYQYVVDGKITKSSDICKSLSTPSNDGSITVAASNNNSTYNYEVHISLTSEAYAINDIIFNEDMSKDKFYKEMNGEAGKPSGLRVIKPKCDASEPDEYKGFSYDSNNTTKVTTVLANACQNEITTYKINLHSYLNSYESSINEDIRNPKHEALPVLTYDGYTFEGWYYDTEYKNLVTGDSSNVNASLIQKDENGCIKGVNDVNIYAKWTKGTTVTTTNQNITVNTSTVKTSEQVTTDVTTQTIHVSTNLLLRSLSISGVDSQMNFDSYKNSYNVKVPNSTTSLNVSYVPMSDKAQVEVIGAENLGVGDNKVVVVVRDTESNATNSYVVNVLRYEEGKEFTTETTTTTSPYGQGEGLPDPEIESSNALLAVLNITNYPVDFNKNVFEYTIEIDDEKELKLNCIPENINANVVVAGNDDVTSDRDIIITVTSENSFYTKVYTVHVKHKKAKDNSKLIMRIVTISLGAVLIGLLSLNKVNKGKMVVKNINDTI